MMKRCMALALLLSFILTWWTSPLPLHAAVTGLKVKIEGHEKTASNIAGTYTTEADSAKTYTISNQASGNARVEAGDEPDWLQLHNAVITANHDGVTGHIYFWVQLDAPPNGTVQYDVMTSGTLRRKVGFLWKGAVGDWIQVAGLQQSPVSDLANGTGGSWACITNAGDPPPCPPSHEHYVETDSQDAILESDTMDIPNVAAQPYLLKGEIWFYLDKKNDKLTLSNGSGVQVKAAAGGGDRRDTGSGPSSGGGHRRPDSCHKCCMMCCKFCSQ